MKKLLMVLLAFLACAGMAMAQIGTDGENPEETADPRIKAALDKLDLKYEVLEGGRFKLVFEVDSVRTQILLINTKTYEYADFEVREIWSPGYRSDGPLPAKIANRLLIDSYDKILGAWQVLHDEDDNTYVAVFAAKISAGADSDAIMSTLRMVVNSADALELELTGEDEY